MNRYNGRDIIISANNNEEVVVLPIVPEINTSKPQDNEEFKTATQGYMNLIGDLGLKVMQVNSIFPASGHYPHMRPGSWDKPFKYVDFFDKWRMEKVPFRVIASRPDGTLWFNLPMTVEDFSYDYTKAGNIVYSLTLKEYKFHWELVEKWNW